MILLLLLLVIKDSIELHHKSDIIKEWYPYNNNSIQISLHKDMIDEYQFTISMSTNSICQPISKMNKTAIEHFIEKEIGYDEILIELIGDNMLSFLGKFALCGTYHKTFTLTKTGIYDVKVTLLSVTNKDQVVLDKQEAIVLMSDSIHLNKTFGTFCPKHVNGVWTTNDSISSSSSSPLVTPLLSSSSSCSDLSRRYTWDSGRGCGIQSITLSDAAVLLSNVTLNCVGDSNIAYLCSLLLKYYCNIITSDNLYIKTSTNAQLCPNLTVTFTKDESCTLSTINNTIINIANCGHNSDTIENFKNIIESVSSKLSFTTSSLLWLEMAPLLSNKMESLRSIEMKNRYATQHFSITHKSNVIVIPTFHSLLPFYKLCEKSNNNDNHNIFLPIYEEILRHVKKKELK